MRTELPVYRVGRATSSPKLDDFWDAPCWANVPVANVNAFRPESSSHHPQTSVRLVYTDAGLHGVFRVDDRYVKSVRVGRNSEVWKDSCVEFFVQPKSAMGYFNFEMNGGGSLLCSYVTDPARLPGGKLTKSEFLPGHPPVGIKSTLPKTVNPEITEPMKWELRFDIPFALLEQFLGTLGTLSGQKWRGNFYKCAEDVSHPHWAAWSPVDDLNFHLPRCFGWLEFE